MNYKSKPNYYNSNEKFETFLFAMLASATLVLFCILGDMAINGLGGSDKPSDFFFDFTKCVILGFPVTWFIIHKYTHIKFYFKEYLPWKKYNAEYQAYHDVLKLNHERRLTEVFIRQVRKS